METTLCPLNLHVSLCPQIAFKIHFYKHFKWKKHENKVRAVTTVKRSLSLGLSIAFTTVQDCRFPYC